MEMTLFAVGVIAIGGAIFSDRVFNAGMALPVGTLLMAVALFLGLAQMLSHAPKSGWRNASVTMEFVGTIGGIVLLLGVIGM